MNHPMQRERAAASVTSVRIASIEDLREHLRLAIELEQALMRMPDGEGTTAGPTFEYLAPERRRPADS